jgi:hypothetical protein
MKPETRRRLRNIQNLIRLYPSHFDMKTGDYRISITRYRSIRAHNGMWVWYGIPKFTFGKVRMIT